MPLKREDIAALLAVAEAQLTHTVVHHQLNLKRLDLSWMIRTPPEELSAARREYGSVSRHQSATSDLSSHRAATTIKAVSPPRTIGVLESTTDEATSSPPQPADDVHANDAVVAAAPLSEGERNLMDSGGHSGTASSQRRRLPCRGERNLQSLAQQRKFDTAVSCEEGNANAASPILLDSPRSVFIVLSNGLGVDAIRDVDPQEFYNEALRTGVSYDMVQLRIAAENNRREQRYRQLLDQYIKMTKRITSEEIVQAVRDQKYGIALEDLRNKSAASMMPKYAYDGGDDLGLMDEDCRHVLEHSRNKTIQEVRRALELREKKIQQDLEREQRALADTAGFEAERRAQELKERDQRQRSVAIRQRAEDFRNRIQRIRQEHDKHHEELRERVEEKEQESETFRKQQELQRKTHSSKVSVKQQEKRQHAKEQVEQRDEQRQREIIEKAEFQTKLHQRELERKREQKAKAARELKEVQDSRARAIRQLAELQQEEKRLKSEDAIERNNARAAEFKTIRAMRLEARRQKMEERTERSAQFRQLAEEKRQRQALETQENYSKKQVLIEEMTAEREQELELRKELGKQARMAQVQEQERVKCVSAFKSVGYLADAEAKAAWLERENKKRELLASHVRQEREALLRARDILLQRANEEEIQRRKEVTFDSLNRTA